MSVSVSAGRPVAHSEYPYRWFTLVVLGNQFSRMTASFGAISDSTSRAFHPPVGAGKLTEPETGR